MRNRAAACAALACVLLVLHPLAPAQALSCVASPTGTQSTRHLAESGTFYGRFDGAVVGVVRGVDKGGTEPLVEVDVEQSFGPRVDGKVRVVGSHWYPMQQGRRYLIPYVLRGGQRHTLLCWDAPQPVGALLRSPTPSAQPTPTSIATRPASGEDDPAWPWVLAATLLVGAAGSLAAVRIRRSRARG